MALVVIGGRQRHVHACASVLMCVLALLRDCVCVSMLCACLCAYVGGPWGGRFGVRLGSRAGPATSGPS